jgi:hypothetical protein
VARERRAASRPAVAKSGALAEQVNDARAVTRGCQQTSPRKTNQHTRPRPAEQMKE